MQEYRYVIKDKEGLHARPAGLLVKKAGEYNCEVTIYAEEKKADAKRIYAVMGLGVKCGQEILLTAQGEMEDEAIGALGEFLEQNL